ncbi:MULTISPECIES: RrF2 family transcriptional regulator [Maribacter]|uniref:RrF2 family transcriptional regulator n=1 Tax=Maribacter TaxID=252356 RepID=UPI00047A4660|nr:MULTISPECIES: Rrf2 family transcriptional regulator [Maribacter]|tara:strand:+ start:158 stop:592 length:435 start_codon:yes stop_codon:yes gene_type:complete
MFSKACEYGIRASTYIALKSLDDTRVNFKEIAEKIDSPAAFTAKVLQQLTRSNIISSVKGPSGGFEIDKIKIPEIKLNQIVHAIDGNKVYEGCGLGLKQCNANKPCPVHDRFVQMRNDLRDMLENTSLYDLTMGIEEGLTFLRR